MGQIDAERPSRGEFRGVLCDREQRFLVVAEDEGLMAEAFDLAEDLAVRLGFFESEQELVEGFEEDKIRLRGLWLGRKGAVAAVARLRDDRRADVADVGDDEDLCSIFRTEDLREHRIQPVVFTTPFDLASMNPLDDCFYDAMLRLYVGWDNGRSALFGRSYPPYP